MYYYYKFSSNQKKTKNSLITLTYIFYLMHSKPCNSKCHDYEATSDLIQVVFHQRLLRKNLSINICDMTSTVCDEENDGRWQRQRRRHSMAPAAADAAPSLHVSMVTHPHHFSYNIFFFIIKHRCQRSSLYLQYCHSPVWQNKSFSSHFKTQVALLWGVITYSTLPRIDCCFRVSPLWFAVLRGRLVHSSAISWLE